MTTKSNLEEDEDLEDSDPAVKYADEVGMFYQTKGQSHLKKALKILDLNSDGLVSKEEMIQVLSFQESAQRAKAETDEIFLKADTNKDGFLDEAEFIAMSLELAQYNEEYEISLFWVFR